MGESKENQMFKDPSSLLILPTTVSPVIAAVPLAIGLAVLTIICTLVPGCPLKAEDSAATFVEVSPNVFLFPDTCNVYVIRTGDTGVAIDCGSAKVLPHLPKIGVKKITWVFFTHHHRDQCQGIQQMIDQGARIAVPEEERQFFADVETFWRDADIYRRYRFKPDFFVLRRSVPQVDRVLKDGEVCEIDGLRITSLKTPGHTPGHAAYLADVAGKTVAFTGDLIHSPGRLWNFHSLEYRYNDCGDRGAKETLDSLAAIASKKPDVALPSHGETMHDLAASTAELRDNLLPVVDYFSRKPCPDWKRVPEPEWLRAHAGGSISFTIVDPEGNGFTIDPGFDQAFQGIVTDPRIKNVEIITVTHYHDDHVLNVNRLKERYRAKVYVQDKLADILEHPTAYSVPCLVDTPIHVDRALRHGESFRWRGIDFTAYDLPSQTYWHQGLLFVKDGKKYFVAGDALYNPRHAQDDNCRNYCRLEEDDGILFSARLLKELNPEYLITGHWGVWRVSPQDFDALIAYCRRIRPLAAKLIAQPDPNMGMDEQWASFYPYRSITQPGRQIAVSLRARNHLGQQATLKADLRGPADWILSPAFRTSQIRRKADESLDFTVTVPGGTAPGRYVLTANVILAGTDYGEIAEAIVDVQEAVDP
jgi:glyoxylase-like metal-dependent hydrolase (beta-lactamase superfamily II)